MSDIELWRVVQYTDRHTGKPVEGAYYIATPDDGRWIVDDHELAEKVVRVLNGYEGAVEDRDALSVMLKRLLDVALVDGYGETVRDEAEALLARIEGGQR
jgi:hypothetical protein